ncbi:MAG TPA: alpha/beta hydrolase domain-containing protein, partial [Dehalococcoidia bacterium]|nr:alpha/beta hydrolase domain-containing protein [Dehalococcoidia bacterium]
ARAAAGRIEMAVTAIEIHSREPYEGGVRFGDTGAYERIDGVVEFAVEPTSDANRTIVDLERAPRGADGMVRFSAGFCVLQPVDPAKANRRLLFDVLNRGRKLAQGFNHPELAEPSDRILPGDGFLFRHGWTLAWCGWQWDVPPGSWPLRIEAPQALDADGRPVQGTVAIEFQPADRVAQQQLGHLLGFFQALPYPAADVSQPDALLTVRDWRGGPRRTLPRERWRFAREQGGRPVADDTFVWLEGGFEPGKLYEVIYRTRACPVAGVGLLSTRDAVAFLRHGTAAAGNPCAAQLDYTYGYGASQSGRFLRHFLYLGLNLDEAGRPVFDGLLPVVAGARRGEFNHRYAQPSVTERPGPGYLPPFLDGDQADAAGGAEAGLLARQRSLGGVPKIVYANTSAEYWGFAGGSLIHTDAAGTRDVEPPENVRIYAFAGTQHAAGRLELMRSSLIFAPAGNPFNVVDYTPLSRAALVNLDRWVSEGVEPPPSSFPRLADGSAVPAAQAIETFRAIPDAALPDPALLPATPHLDLGPEMGDGVVRHPVEPGEPYPQVVSAVDADGNEVAGIRLPELSVPVAAYTGWNVRDAAIGGAGQLVLMAGSTLPFAATVAERQRRGDPRPAIAERYRDREDYAARARAAAEQLAAQRYLLADDIDLVVENALARYDAFAPAAVPAGD